jgi:hypothetical protein
MRNKNFYGGVVMSKLKLDMTTMDMILVMSEGNPGALTVVMQLLEREDGFPTILCLDSLGLYGSKVYMLWSDVCKKNLDLMTNILLEYRRGNIKKEELFFAIDHYGKGLEKFLEKGEDNGHGLKKE